MYKIKSTTLSPVYKFDRSFTEKWYKKIAWLMLVVALTFVAFYSVSLYLFPNLEDFEAVGGESSQGRLMLLFRLLYDPSTIDKLTPGARTFGVVVVIVGMIIFMGMLISVASNILNTHVDKYEKGEFGYTFDYHYIILGFNHTVPALIKKIRNDKRNTNNAILILSDMPSNEIRSILNNELDREQRDKVVIKNGQRTSRKTLEELSVDKAIGVWVIGEVEEFGHDPLNIKCLNLIVDICRNSDIYINDRVSKYENRLEVFVQFEEQSTLSAFQTENISVNWALDPHNDKSEKLIRFRASNYHDDWARKLIVINQYDGEKNNGKYPALDAPNGIPTTEESNKHVHLVIFGMTQMGLAIAKRAAHNIHLPNFVRDNNLKTVITFIDKDAKSGMEMFRNRYAQIFEIQSSDYKDFTQDDIVEKHYCPTKFTGKHADFLDVNYQFIQAEPESERVRNYLACLANEKDTLLSIAVCYDDPNTNLNIGLNLPRNVYYPMEDGKVIPVFIRQFTCGSLLDIFMNENGRFRNVYPFGMWDGCEFEEEKDSLLAKRVNAVYFNGEEKEFEKNDIDNKWKNLKVTDHWSSQYSADSIEIKKRCVGGEINEDNNEILANVEHNRWNMAQLLMGFYFDEALNVKTAEKDKLRLLHSCIRPFSELSEDTKNLDRFIVAKMPQIEKL
ncbi:MAG: hypothetical protein MJZ00_00620 [Paludibacteraceae bacterium]|nr:hypothetical protein [Paludibacteraceae bacterium]